jgi:hypothetical protein
VQPEEYIAMLKEFGQIARGMMFLHGHFTHPQDAAETGSVAAKPSAKMPVVKKSRPRRSQRALMALCAGLPTRISSFIQIR